MKDGDDPAFLEALAEARRLRDSGTFDAEAFRAAHPAHAETVFEEISSTVPSGSEASEETPASRGMISSEVSAPPSEFRRLGDYELEVEIGRGGQGVVYKATDLRLRRKVALKVLNEMAAGSVAMRRRLQREAEAASKLDHPGICAVYDLGEADGIPYIAMRYIEGDSLAERIAKHRSDPGWAAAGTTTSQDELRAWIKLVVDVARALHVAHEAGLIHRDIKPANVVITADEQPVILDFGLARDESSDQPALTLSGQIMGTPAYMAPEQIAAERISVDRRADVYALGVMLFECLTLKLPFEAPTRDQLYHQIMVVDAPDPTKLNRAVTRDLKVVLATALDKNRDRRYQTAAALADDLDRVLRFEPIQARPAGPLVRAHRFAKRRPAAAALLLVTLFGLPVLGAMGGYIVSNLEVTQTGYAKLREDQIEDALQEGFMLASARDGHAIERFAAVLDLVPQHVEAIAGTVVTHLQRREKNEALAVLDRHRKTEAATPALRRLRARVLQRLKRDDESAAIREQLPPPGNAIDHFLLGLDWVQIGIDQKRPGPYARALGHFEQALLLSPNRVRMLNFLEIAKVAAKAGDPAAARRVATALVRNWPDRYLAWYAAGLALAPIEPKKAIDHFDKALTLNPDAGYVYHDRGNTLHDLKRHEEAAASLERAVELEPRVAYIRGNLAATYDAGGRPEEAKRALREALAIQPNHRDLLYHLGRILAREGDTEQAIALLERADQTDTSAWILEKLGGIYASVGRVDDAIDAYRRALRERPRDIPSLVNLGRVYGANKAPKLARQCYLDVLKIDPRHPEARTNLGTLDFRSRNLESALRSFEKVLEYHPDFYDAMYNRAIVLTALKRHDEAIAQLEAIGRQHPDRAQAWCRLGVTLAEVGRPDDGVKALRKAIQLGFRQARVQLAAVLINRGEYEEAIDLLRQAVALDPASRSTRLDLGHVYLQRGRPEQAIAVFQEIVERWPTHLSGYWGLDRCYQALKQPDESIRILERAAAAIGPDANDHYSLGHRFSDLGRREDAIRCLRRAVKLDAGHAEAHCNLGHALGANGQVLEGLASLRRGHYLGTQGQDWRYPSKSWFRRAEQHVLSHLSKVLAGPDSDARDAAAAKLLTALVDGLATDVAANGKEAVESKKLAVRLRENPRLSRLRVRTPGLAVWERLDGIGE